MKELVVNPEQMNSDFQKYHLIHDDKYLASLHIFTGVDLGFPHDHPWDFLTYVVSGGYVEDVYTLGDDGSWSVERIARLPGTVHSIKAEHIHKIVELPQGICRTLVCAGPHRRETCFWYFGDTVKWIQWNEEDIEQNWKQYHG